MVDRFVQVDQRRQHLIRCFVPCPDCPSWSKDLRSMSISNGRSGRLSEIIMEVENHQFLVDNGHPKSGAMPFIRWPMIMSKQCKRHKNFTRTLKAIACASKERSLLQKPTEGPMTSPFLEEPVGESEKEPRLRTPQALGRVSPSLRPRSAGTQSREHWVHWHLVLPLPRFFPPLSVLDHVLGAGAPSPAGRLVGMARPAVAGPLRRGLREVAPGAIRIAPGTGTDSNRAHWGQGVLPT